MTLQEIYELAIKMGIESDPRGEKGVKRDLKYLKKKFDKLEKSKKDLFDSESLTNPFSDSRILYGNPKKQIKKVLAGIDAAVAELLLLDRLNQKGDQIDLLISHHPDGHALASLHEVMDVQIDMFTNAGVPRNVSYALMSERKDYIRRAINPLNHNRSIDAAKLLDIPLISLHTVWDNLGNYFITEYLGKKEFDRVGEVLDEINKIPEFIEGNKGKAGPSIVSGSEDRPAGKIHVSFTGGTNPSKELYTELAKAGVGTLIEMHVSEEAVKELRKHHINVIDTGHMPADSIGANLFLDELEKNGVEVVPCSGLIRIKR